jgi:hypothetical protein
MRGVVKGAIFAPGLRKIRPLIMNAEMSLLLCLRSQTAELRLSLAVAVTK